MTEVLARLERCGGGAGAVVLRGSALRAEHLRMTDEHTRTQDDGRTSEPSG
jgi:hypothetical protein